MLERLDDVGMAQRHHQHAFTGPLQARKASVELGCFFLVQNLEAYDAAQALVAGAPDLGHASLPGAAYQLDALADIDNRQFAFLLLGAAAKRKAAHIAPLN